MRKILLLPVLILCMSCATEEFTASSKNNFSLNSGMGYADNTAWTGDQYNEFEEHPFIDVSAAPVSTFSVDADGASYSNVRRFIRENEKPPKAAIRTEELVNYFQLDYEKNNSEHPISLNGEVSTCPWEPAHKLIRIGIKGHDIPESELPPSNFVFLIDVSGSMSSPDKLELLKSGFLLMLDELTDKDRIAIVTYAGTAGVLLPSTSGDDYGEIRTAIEKLSSGGSTAGAQGIVTAYEIAQQNFIEGGNNRVILGTDGDFNVGISDQDELVKLIEGKRDLGIYLTVLGVGRGNLNDGAMEQIANHGNGIYEYIDHLEQAKKVFIYEKNKFYPAAKDVKVQVEFNPELVEAYRLIGYENRLLNEEDFEDDEKDAGEINVGQNITALYEIKPASGTALRYVPTFTIKFRYKNPGLDISIPMDLEIFDEGKSFIQSSDHMRFTASVAGFGMLLRDSPYKGNLDYDDVLSWTKKCLNFDPYGFKLEFAEVIMKARNL